MSWPLLPPAFWITLAVCTLAFAAIWWEADAHKGRRLRALSARIQVWSRIHAPPPATDVRALQSVTQSAVSKLRDTCGTGGLYARPWLLFVGDPASEVASLLEWAHPAGPVALARDDAEHAFWRWWLMHRLAAIEVCPPPMAPEQPIDGLWLCAMKELAEQRPNLPIDGIVLCVSASTLSADPAVSGPTFQRLCRRSDDAAISLCIRLPVYVVVTDLQRLPGYATVLDMLPPEALRRALGHRAALSELPVTDDVFTTLFQQLEAMRLGLLQATSEPDKRAAIHGFVEHMRTLRTGLALLMVSLTQTCQSGQRLDWRGLYFTGGGQPGGVFVADLFDRFLPVDHGLARPMN